MCNHMFDIVGFYYPFGAFASEFAVLNTVNLKKNFMCLSSNVWGYNILIRKKAHIQTLLKYHLFLSIPCIIIRFLLFLSWNVLLSFYSLSFKLSELPGCPCWFFFCSFSNAPCRVHPMVFHLVYIITHKDYLCLLLFLCPLLLLLVLLCFPSLLRVPYFFLSPPSTAWSCPGIRLRITTKMVLLSIIHQFL